MDIKLTKTNGVASTDIPIDYAISQLRNGEYTITIKRKVKPRSISQNALMWLWLACISDASGYDKDELHELYKMKFNGRIVSINGHEVRIAQSTTKLSSADFGRYLDNVQRHAATMWGIRLPNPEDQYFEVFRAQWEGK